MACQEMMIAVRCPLGISFPRWDVIGSPLVKEAVIRLENGKTFIVRVENYAGENVHIKSIKLNGNPYKKSFITHSDVINGGELVFEMSNKPNKKSSSYRKPYSFTN